jgi:hypothetical protein
MLQSMFIQNFRAWEDQTFSFNGENALFAGESESGKSSVLQALDLFFNRSTIDSANFRDPNKDVSVGIRYGGTTYKKTFSCKTHQVKSRVPASSWRKVEAIHYIYLPATRKTSAAILTELAQAKADSLLPPELADELEKVAQQAMDEVLANIVKRPAAATQPAQSKRANVTAVPKILPARAIDFTIQNNGVPVAGAELGYSKNLTYAMLVGSRYDNVILGVDDIEHAFSEMNYQKVIRNLEEHVGQMLATTRSRQVVQHIGSAITVPVGHRADGSMANILRGLNGNGKAFLLVEGKYDLPWFKAAAQLAGFGSRLDILPAGGSNIDELRREMSEVGMNCVAIVDGDTRPDERTGKYALKRDCVELYAPDELLQALFGVVPSKANKKDFFAQVQAAHSSSENGIKAAISEHIADHLTTSSAFVREVAGILTQALAR